MITDSGTPALRRAFVAGRRRSWTSKPGSPVRTVTRFHEPRYRFGCYGIRAGGSPLWSVFMFETVKAIHEALGITSPKMFIATVTVLFAFIGFVAAEIVERGYQNTLRRNSASPVPQQPIMPTPSIPTSPAGTAPPNNPPLPRKKKPPLPREKEQPKDVTVNLEQRSARAQLPNIWQRLETIARLRAADIRHPSEPLKAAKPKNPRFPCLTGICHGNVTIRHGKCDRSLAGSPAKAPSYIP